MFAIAFCYVKVRRKAPAFHTFHTCLFSDMQAKGLFLASTKRDASPNNTRYTQQGSFRPHESLCIKRCAFFYISPFNRSSNFGFVSGKISIISLHARIRYFNDISSAVAE